VSAARLSLTITGLHKRYGERRGLFGAGRASVRALNGVNLTAAKGQTLAIVGESGCGKTTLAKILIGLETASEGRVELEGHEVSSVRVEARPAEVKRAVQMVFQNPGSTLSRATRSATPSAGRFVGCEDWRGRSGE
jgi:ABC-type glutathione transport system ATPase component